MKRPLSPCKVCTDRNAECHGKCNNYNEYTMKHEKYKGLVNETRRRETSVIKYENERYLSMRRRYI